MKARGISATLIRGCSTKINSVSHLECTWTKAEIPYGRGLARFAASCPSQSYLRMQAIKLAYYKARRALIFFRPSKWTILITQTNLRLRKASTLPLQWAIHFSLQLCNRQTLHTVESDFSRLGGTHMIKGKIKSIGIITKTRLKTMRARRRNWTFRAIIPSFGPLISDIKII